MRVVGEADVEERFAGSKAWLAKFPLVAIPENRPLKGPGDQVKQPVLVPVSHVKTALTILLDLKGQVGVGEVWHGRRARILMNRYLPSTVTDDQIGE